MKDYRKRPLNVNKDLKNLSDYIKAISFGNYNFKINSYYIEVKGKGSFGNTDDWSIRKLPIDKVSGLTYGQWVDLLIEISEI
jgi:hypothetical protein